MPSPVDAAEHHAVGAVVVARVQQQSVAPQRGQAVDGVVGVPFRGEAGGRAAVGVDDLVLIGVGEAVAVGVVVDAMAQVAVGHFTQAESCSDLARKKS